VQRLDAAFSAKADRIITGTRWYQAAALQGLRAAVLSFRECVDALFRLVDLLPTAFFVMEKPFSDA
jgi:hypothetical protein